MGPSILEGLFALLVLKSVTGAIMGASVYLCDGNNNRVPSRPFMNWQN